MFPSSRNNFWTSSLLHALRTVYFYKEKAELYADRVSFTAIDKTKQYVYCALLYTLTFLL